jgi:glycosyltransferase involved in cell wall biosynthesis
VKTARHVFVNVDGTQNPGNCRLLYVVGQLHTGGLERQLYYLLRSMDRDCYRPGVAVWNYTESDVHVPLIRALGVPLYAIAPTAPRFTKLRAFRRLVRRLRPEVVHSYGFYTNIAAWWAAFGTQAIAIGSIRSDFQWAKAETGPVLGRLCARWPRYHIANSFTAAAAARHSRSVFAPKQCEVVHNGLDLHRFSQSDVTPGPARIVGLGYLLPVKRWDRLLRAALALKRGGLDYTVTIVGDGPLRRALEHQAQQLEVSDRVRFLPHTDDVPRVLAAASFLVLPSDSEGCPNAVMEAMACGRAVVATAVGDIPRLVQDGTTGFLVRSGDDAMLVERLAELIRDPERCRDMGIAGRQRAEREFGLDRLARDMLAAYREAGWCEHARPPAPVEALVRD